jgi:23S rRNA (guanosine2251-2'-O)-methyltransferase
VELLYGRNAVTEALRARRRVQRVLVARGSHGLDAVLAAARQRHVPVETVERDRLDRALAQAHHQGVAAEVEPFVYAHLDDLLDVDETARRGEPPLVLVLDSLQDPQNFGSLLRTAQACGAHGVVIPEHRAVGVTPAVSNASAGAVEHVRIARVTNLRRAIDALKQRGLWTYGLAPGAPSPCWTVDWSGPVALVVGSEGSGLSRLVREGCDALVEIPMAAGAVQSLNAAVAGSIALYEAVRQRSQPPRR